MPRLIEGNKLTEEQREMVLTAFVGRDTVESPFNSYGRIVGGGVFARITDEDWLRSHSFWFADDGTLMERNAEAHYPFPSRDSHRKRRSR
jgi:hypothetical protein